ncbi:MAG: LmeA family phospholipid-binding protein [Bacillota bacterium]
MGIRRPWLLGSIAFSLVAVQAAFAPSLAGLLRRHLTRRAVEFAALTVKVAPLTWFDLLAGRLRRVEVRAEEISFGGPRLALLHMDLRELVLAPRKVFFSGEAAVRSLGPSEITARVEEKALNEYCRKAYPALPVSFSLAPNKISLSGRLEIFGRVLSFSTSGRLSVAKGDCLRYVPAEIEAAGRRLPSSWLAAYGEKLALEFPLALPLPVVLREVRLGDGYLEVLWRESPADRESGRPE